MSKSFGLVARACMTMTMIMTATSAAGGTQHARANQKPREGASVEEVLRDSTERRLDDYPRQYILWKSEDIKNKVLEWKGKYPDLIHVTTSQEAYGLPRSGGKNDCPFDEGGDGCLHYIVTIQDFVAHPEDSESSNHLPEVFWSGCVHGTYLCTSIINIHASFERQITYAQNMKYLTPSHQHFALQGMSAWALRQLWKPRHCYWKRLRAKPDHRSLAPMIKMDQRYPKRSRADWNWRKRVLMSGIVSGWRDWRPRDES